MRLPVHNQYTTATSCPMFSQSVENKDIGVLESHRLKAPSFRRKRKVFDLPFLRFTKYLPPVSSLSLDAPAESTVQYRFW